MNETLQLGNILVDSQSLAEMCRRYNVRELSVFGSAVRGEMGPDSDIDILVEFEPGVRIEAAVRAKNRSGNQERLKTLGAPFGS